MGNTAEHAPEDQTVRQYRFLLRSAPVDALQAAHHEALDRLTEDDRARILTAVQEGLVAGQRLRPGNTSAIARLVSIGERRNPRGFLDACDPTALRSLAQAVIQAEAAFGLFSGYAAWDGVDPEPTDLGEDHGGTGARESLGVQVNTARELARVHAAQTGVGAGGAGF
jgi:hypothetical protein